MNRISLTVILLLTALAFTGCKKESEDGGISFSFTPTKPYQYTSLAVAISQARYSTPVATATTPHVNGLKIIGLKPGNYFWEVTLHYTDGPQIGTFSFHGEIIIEKGKIMHITLED